MMRWLGCSVTVLLFLAGGVFSDDKTRPTGEKPVNNERPTVKGDGKDQTAGPLFEPGPFIKQFDRNRDGQLSQEELPPRLRHSFKQIDTNGDGQLNVEELKQGVAYLQPRRRPSDVVFVLIEMSDCDECCIEELQRVYDVLHRLDKNKNGKINLEELKGARLRLVGQRIDDLIQELDTNKDAKLARSEVMGRLRQDFDKLDANRDGFIDRDELMRGASEGVPGADPKAPGARNAGKDTSR